MINPFRRWREKRELDAAIQSRIAALEEAIHHKEVALAQARYEQSKHRIARVFGGATFHYTEDPVDSPATWPKPFGVVADENCRPIKINWPKTQELAGIVKAARQRAAEEHAQRFDLTPLDLQYLMEMEQAFHPTGWCSQLHQKGGSHELVS